MLADRAHGAPVVPRQPLWAGRVRIGSVAPVLFQRLAVTGLHPEDLGFQSASPDPEAGWQLPSDPTDVLLQLGQALEAAGLVPASRKEWLDVTGADNEVMGAVHRDLVRLLGLTTHSVHLVGLTPQGHCWVQQRAPGKAEDPGMWDTLVGGTLARGESPQRALERELWEEAGLRPDQLSPLLPCGELRIEQARDADGLAFQVERIHCFVARLQEELEPHNQDGEVSAFACLSPQRLNERLLAGAFTVESASVLMQVNRSLGVSGLAILGS